MVTFKSCTDTRQISDANSRWYLILLVPSWKIMSFGTKGLRFLVRNRAAFSLASVLPQKQCVMLTRHNYSKTAWSNSQRNDRTFSININTDYTHTSTFWVLLLPCDAKRQRG